VVDKVDQVEEEVMMAQIQYILEDHEILQVHHHLKEIMVEEVGV